MRFRECILERENAGLMEPEGQRGIKDNLEILEEQLVAFVVLYMQDVAAWGKVRALLAFICYG